MPQSRHDPDQPSREADFNDGQIEAFEKVEAFEQAEQELEMWEQRRALDRAVQERQMWSAYRATQARGGEPMLGGKGSMSSEPRSDAASKHVHNQVGTRDYCSEASLIVGKSRDSLRVPREWIERRLEQIEIEVSYYPASIEKWASEFRMQEEELLDCIKADLSAGIAVADTNWKSQNGGTKTKLFGTRWFLVVRPQEAEESGVTMAVLDGIKQLDIPTNRNRLVPATLSFNPIWEETSSDLRTWVRRYRAATEFVLELTRPQTDRAVGRRIAIHNSIRRQFSALRVMMDLLQLRSDREALVFQGEVVSSESSSEAASVESPIASDGSSDTRTNMLRLQLCKDVSDDILDEDAFVELSVEMLARPMRARIRSIANVGGSLQVEVDLAADTFPIGAKVETRTVSRFGMRAHQRAVRDLLAERVEGRWPDLARLLSSPDCLESPVAVPCQRYFNGKLNKPQRRAVDGALSTHHAFCIQGPPGTGKTTVICELIEQLIAKGERVLLVAPTHVAVDEVLRRIGTGEGVRALRLAWDDSKVSEDVRKFTPSKIIEPFLDRVRQRESGRHTHWRDEQESIREAIDLLERWDKMERDYVRVRKEKDEADEAKRNTDDTVAAEKQNLSEVESSIEEAKRNIARLRQAATAAKMRFESLRSDSGWLKNVVGKAGFGEIGRARQDAVNAEKAIADEIRGFDNLTQRRKRAETKVDTLRERKYRAREDAKCKAAQLRTALKHKERAANACRENELISQHPTAAWDGLLDSMRDRSDRLEAYQDLSSRFDDLVAKAADDDENLEGLRRDLLAVTNLFCCTTTGIAGSPELRDLVFDTLIVDEASRVTDSEFLISANRARRWILVGDEHQLPPYVEQNDEHFIHALSALNRVESSLNPHKDEDEANEFHPLSENSPGMPELLETAVNELAELWEEDEELHRFRRDSVLSFANRVLSSGDWDQAYRSAYAEGIKYLRSEVDDPSRALLRAMRDNLVRSLFERVVTNCFPEMKVRLIEQRRMIEPIAAIVSDPVYQGKYRTPCVEDLASNGITPLTTSTFSTPITFLDTSILGIRARDKLQRNSFVNPTEARWIAEACRTLDRELIQAGSPPVTVSILTFYKAQARLIRDKLFAHQKRGRTYRFGCLRFSVIDAIDKIQGQESDVVFLSFCRTAGKHVSPRFGQWLQDLRRLNVACTRAHRALVFVGQRELLGRLCSNEPAMEFYRHLNDLFETRTDSMRVIRQFGGNER